MAQLVFEDDFDRADSSDLGSNWDEFDTGLSIASNKLSNDTSAGLSGTAVYTGVVLNNQEVQAIVSTSSIGGASDNANGLIARRANSSYYSIHMNWDTGELKLQKNVSGVWTTLGSIIKTVAINTDYLLRLICKGNSIEAWFDKVGEEKGVAQISVEDSSISSGSAGVRAPFVFGVNEVTWNDFKIFNLNVPAEGFVTPNKIFLQTINNIPSDNINLNSAIRNPNSGTWEDLKWGDKRIENYKYWAYPFNDGKYTSPIIDLGKQDNTGTTTAPNSTTIALNTTASDKDDFYNNWDITVVDNGSIKKGKITDYFGSSRVAVLDFTIVNQVTNTPVTLSGKVFYNTKIKIIPRITQHTTNYTPESLQMDDNGRVRLNIKGKCNIMKSRTGYKGEFGRKATNALTQLNYFWIDSNRQFVFVSKRGDDFIQKLNYKDLSIVQEVDNSDIGITFGDERDGLGGITGDSEYIYYLYNNDEEAASASYVIKRRQSDLAFIDKKSTLTGDSTALNISSDTGLWWDGTNLFICDKYNDRVIKSDSTLAYIADYLDATNFTPISVWGGSSSESSIYVLNNHTIEKSARRITKSTMSLNGTSTVNLTFPRYIFGDGAGAPNIYILEAQSYPKSNRLLRLDATLAVVIGETDKLGPNNEKSYFGGGFGNVFNNQIYLSFRRLHIMDTMNVDLTWGGTEKTSPSSTADSIPQFASITGDDKHFYISDHNTQRIIKVNRNTLIPITTTPHFFDLVGGDFTKIERAMRSDDSHLYITIDTYSNPDKIIKVRKDTMQIEKIGLLADGATNYSPALYEGMAVDGGFIYISNGFGEFTKWKTSDLSFVASNTNTNKAEINSPRSLWADGDYIYVTNHRKLTGKTDYSISILSAKTSTFGNFLTSYEFSKFDRPYGITGDTTEGYLYTTNIGEDTTTFNILGEPVTVYDSFITKIQYDRDIGFLYSATLNFGSQGLGKSNFDRPRSIHVDSDYIFIADSGNYRIMRRYKDVYFRVKLLTDESTSDGLPSKVNDAYRGYDIVLVNHPEISQFKSRRKVISYNARTNRIRVARSNPLFVKAVNKLNNVRYRMVYKSEYFDDVQNIHKNPKIRIKTSDRDSLLTSIPWESYSPQKEYSAVRFVQYDSKFEVKDHQANIEVDTIQFKAHIVLQNDGGTNISIPSSTDATKIFFNKRFNEIPRINATVDSTTAAYAVVSNATIIDTTNYPPFGGFDVRLFDGAGTQIAGTLLSWTATEF
ncbi:MAG: hypothetical protein ACE5HR_00200 [bacterium]